MKIKIFMLLNLIVIGLITNAQDSCKVLVKNLQGNYQGECKKGLAHGKGEAKGIDFYVGNFKKGYPNGKGTYTWANGYKYEGEWDMGQRDGEGKYFYRENGKDLIQDGIWKNNSYQGTIPILPVIIEKRNITSTSFVRLRDGNQISIKIMQNGVAQQVEDLNILPSSGVEFKSGGTIAYHNIDFPFHCKIIFKGWNKLHTMLYDCTLEFSVTQPGNWELRIDN